METDGTKGRWVMDGATWMVVIKYDTEPPQVTLHDNYQEARDLHDLASLNWSEVYLCRVISAPGVGHLRSGETIEDRDARMKESER